MKHYQRYFSFIDKILNSAQKVQSTAFCVHQNANIIQVKTILLTLLR